MAPRPGERVDHPHHVGMWLNYEDVNGYDYWNNSNSIVESLKSHKMGTIRHESIGKISEGSQGSLSVTAAWIDEDGKGKRVLDESTIDLSIVSIYSIVQIKNTKSGMTVTYNLVSEEEADLKEGKISVSSPFGKGLLGKKVGDLAEITAPAGKLEFEIISFTR